MSTVILRRRRLGKTSCEGIVDAMDSDASLVRNDTMSDEDFVGCRRVIRWGCTSSVPIQNVLNTADAIHGVNDKAGFRRILFGEELSPPTYYDEDLPFLYRVVASDNQFITRPSTHSQGRRLFVVTNSQSLDFAISQCGEGWYASPLIDKVAEFRVFVVSGKAVAVAQKTPGNPDQVAWNVAQGGRFDNVRWGDWDVNVVKNALQSFNASTLDFGGVDVMIDRDGFPYTIEINSAPSLTSPYRQLCIAKSFDYIAANGKERIDSDMQADNWQAFVHPSIIGSN